MREKKILQNYDLYLLIIPCLVFYIIFMYAPMYGVQLAFKNFKAGLGIAGSPWVGLAHFQRFFTSPYFSRLVVNTLSLSALQLLFGFPLPVLLALMINELHSKRMRKIVQNIT